MVWPLVPCSPVGAAMSDLRLVSLSPAVLEALAARSRSVAEDLTGLSMSSWFAGRVEIWLYMLTLLEGRPDNAEWLMQAVVMGPDEVIGNAGCKGAPIDGEIEIGYSIDPRYRRRGHASTVVGLLLQRASAHPDVDHVIARINPSNTASIGVVTKSGFVPDGTFDSPRSGLRLQFLRRTPSTGDTMTSCR